MATPVGEDSWLAYLDETVRNASDLEQRVNAVEIHKRAVSAEPGSLRMWLAYCNYFWSLWGDTQSPEAGWSEEERMMGRELFSFGAALDLWQQGYEAIKYRISDSHQLWDRWISLEMELLSKTRTPEGIKRITHLFRNRLVTPHLTWDETSQAFSSFLSEYNRSEWEESMKEVTASAQEAKRLIAQRDPFELKLKQAARAGDIESQKSLMIEYLEWEMRQSKRNNDNPDIGMDLCRGLYARALTGLLATDENIWHEYIVYLSSSHADPHAAASLLDVLCRAVQHCPSSGQLWNRYILCAEEAKLAFSEIESIKHAATSEDQLYKDGMESMIEMYVAWCGFLKRTAMGAGAGDEAVDVADVGLPAALEDVAVVGKRLYGKDFQGDPKFRLERIYIQYLTERKGAIDDARAQWNKLASTPIHADSHDFWLRYYLWEMLIFSSKTSTIRSPTPSSGAAGLQIPSLATSVLTRAVARTSIDWPEKVLEVYLQHCNDYESPASVRRATDRVHKTAREIKRLRELQQRDKENAYAAYYAQHPEKPALEVQSAGESKRKRDEFQHDAEIVPEGSSKRQKNEAEVTQVAPGPEDAQEQQAVTKRDRENTTIIVQNLPGDVTQPKLRQYFKDYGHINNITALVRDDKTQSSTALIEFRRPDEAQSALLRDGKYFGQSQLKVDSGHNLTIYVTNYPPAADEKYIRGIFKDCGEILSIRWPSLKVNTHRRFCYVSFRDHDAAAAATKKDGTVLEGRYRLVAKYSDPGHKKSREGALAEGREVHVTNLDKGTSESELREVFSKYGTVTRVNIPQTMGGKNRGFAFLDFESKGQAENAVLELNNAKFRNQILQVDLSRESKIKPSAKTMYADHESASSAPPSVRDAEGDDAMVATHQHKPTEADISARTIALMGLPDTINDARVHALVEPLGTIVKLVLRPTHGGAKIEFADVATAGKAALKLDGMEFEGCKLRIGSLEELRHAKPEHKDDRASHRFKGHNPKEAPESGLRHMMPPPMARRPGQQRGGPRRGGLGFVAARKIAEGDESGKAGGIPNGKPGPKSNADFKAMFLASEEKKEGENGV
ncbi:Splicing factor [Amphichorda felina]